MTDNEGLVVHDIDRDAHPHGASRNSHETPQPYAYLMDAACAMDRKWFEEHPGKRQYVRFLQDGELWPFVATPPPEGCHNVIRVTALAPGNRVRELIVIHIPTWA